MRALAWVAPTLLACACSRTEPAPTTVHTLRLPEEAVTLPDAPGRETLLSGCSTCHSPRYVLDQPSMPRKTWQAEVEKMRATYGAPLVATDVPVIVDYLVTVRGTGG